MLEHVRKHQGRLGFFGLANTCHIILFYCNTRSSQECLSSESTHFKMAKVIATIVNLDNRGLRCPSEPELTVWLAIVLVSMNKLNENQFDM